eukprot:SAG11_NODE_23148_length_394_cov_0.861017_1_plen_109_part_10
MKNTLQRVFVTALHSETTRALNAPVTFKVSAAKLKGLIAGLIRTHQPRRRHGSQSSRPSERRTQPSRRRAHAVIVTSLQEAQIWSDSSQSLTGQDTDSAHAADNLAPQG